MSKCRDCGHDHADGTEPMCDAVINPLSGAFCPCTEYCPAASETWQSVDADEKVALLKFQLVGSVTPRDWIEDLADDDNGDYQHTCSECGEHFRGHKRRFGSCKKCWVRFAIGIIIKYNRQALSQEKTK